MLLIYGFLIYLLQFSVLSSHQLDEKQLNVTVKKSAEDKNELVYIEKVELSGEQTAKVFIEGFNNESFGFATLQVHSFYYNLSIHDGITSYYGTNNGFFLKADGSSRVYQFINSNHVTMHFMVVIIGYTNGAPIPAGCSMKENSTSMNLFETEEKEHFLLLTIPPATESLGKCDNTRLTYETYYTYIEPLDFNVDSYFDALERVIFDNIFSTYHTKNFSRTQTHLFEAIAGRGLVVNTVVKNRNGEMSFYIPYATYSCPPNTWLAHCSDISFLRRAISFVLVMHSVMMMLNLMAPDFIEAILNGMLYGGFFATLFLQTNELSLQQFDTFIVILVVGLFCGALFGTLSLYMPVGRYLSKLTYCNIVAAFIIESVFDKVTSIALQFILAFIFSVILGLSSITYSAILGGLVMILNLSYLIKVGNLHRFIINNYLAFTTIPSYTSESFYDYIRPNFINYKVSLTVVDYALIVFYVLVAVYLTVRKEHYFFENPAFVSTENLFPHTTDVDSFNCANARRRRDNRIVGIQHSIPSHHQHRIISRSRRLHRIRPEIINERSPLISHWLTSEEGDDDVFETPTSSRYMQILTAGPSDRTIRDEDELSEIERLAD